MSVACCIYECCMLYIWVLYVVYMGVAHCISGCSPLYPGLCMLVCVYKYTCTIYVGGQVEQSWWFNRVTCQPTSVLYRPRLA